MIEIKTEKEIEYMREAGRIVALALDAMEKAIKPGVTTKDLDRIAEQVLKENGAKPSFKGQEGFEGSVPYPATICASVNNEIIHGIPGSYKLKEGDIISIDMGAIKNMVINNHMPAFRIQIVVFVLKALFDHENHSTNIKGIGCICFALGPFNGQSWSAHLSAFFPQNVTHSL